MLDMPHPVSGLSGRRAVVTGGASGIGAAIADRLADLGAHVTVLDRDGDAAAKVAADIGGDHREIDLTDGAAIDAQDLDADLLVNGAGIQHVAPVEDFDPDVFTAILAADARVAVPARPPAAARHVRRAASAGSCTCRACTATAPRRTSRRTSAPSTGSRACPR